MILSSAYAPDRTMRLATRHTWRLFSLNFMGPRIRTGTVLCKADAEHVTRWNCDKQTEPAVAARETSICHIGAGNTE